MKKLVTVLAVAATLVASPAFSKTNASKVNANARAAFASAESSDVVTYGSKRGQDPDWFIRFQVLRDFQAAH